MSKTPTDWAAENRRGREYALALIAQAKAENSPMPFCTATRDMVKRGEYDALAVGFFTEIAIQLTR